MTITIPSGSNTYNLMRSGTIANNAGTRGKLTVGVLAGVYITGSNDTLVNTGTIIGGYANPAFNYPISPITAGVVIKGGTGDSVSNQAGGYIQNKYSLGVGIEFYNTAGTITNGGTITGGVGSQDNSGVGIVLLAGGQITNLGTGTILTGIEALTDAITGTIRVRYSAAPTIAASIFRRAARSSTSPARSRRTVGSYGV